LAKYYGWHAPRNHNF